MLQQLHALCKQILLKICILIPSLIKQNIMGPFPHDAPVATITAENPAGTDGFEFVEFAHPEPQELEALFTRMGYVQVARHKTKDIRVWRQGDINYILNNEKGSHGNRFVDEHGPCAPSMAWRVVDAKHAFDHAVSKGAEPYMGDDKSFFYSQILQFISCKINYLHPVIEAVFS